MATASTPINPVMALASTSVTRPFRQAYANTRASSSVRLRPRRDWNSRCSSVSRASLERQTSNACFFLSLSITGGTWPNACQLRKIARMPVPACSLKPSRRNAATMSGLRTSLGARARLQEFVRAGEGVAWIPEHRSITKQADAGVAVLIAVVLMEQQIDGRLAEGNVVRRVVIAPKRCGHQSGTAVRRAAHSVRDSISHACSRFSSTTIRSLQRRSGDHASKLESMNGSPPPGGAALGGRSEGALAPALPLELARGWRPARQRNSTRAGTPCP